jgi:hypothetical protein
MSEAASSDEIGKLVHSNQPGGGTPSAAEPPEAHGIHAPVARGGEPQAGSSGAAEEPLPNDGEQQACADASSDEIAELVDSSHGSMPSAGGMPEEQCNHTGCYGIAKGPSPHDGELRPKPEVPVGGTWDVLKELPGDECATKMKGLSSKQRNVIDQNLWEQAPHETKDKCKHMFVQQLYQYHQDRTAYDQIFNNLERVPHMHKRPVGGARQVFVESLSRERPAALEGLSIVGHNPIMSKLWLEAPDSVKARCKAVFEERLAQYLSDKAAVDKVRSTLPLKHVRLQAKTQKHRLTKRPAGRTGHSLKRAAACLSSDEGRSYLL